MKVILALLGLAIYIFGLIDAVRSDPDERMGLPRAFWIILVAFFPPLGAIIWIVVSRIARVNTAIEDYRATQSPTRKRRGVAPDDDPEFLSKLRTDHDEPGGRS